VTRFLTQEIGSLPKATPEQIAAWAGRLGQPSYGPADAPLADRRSRFNLAFLRAAGLDLVYDGEAHRIEMGEHPYRAMEGVAFVGHVRSFDNKYFRKAAVRGRVGLRSPYHSDEFRFVVSTGLAADTLKVPVTGPYTLADWLFNDYYGVLGSDRYAPAARARGRRELVLDIARRVVRPTVSDLVRLGASRVQIDEPALGTHPSETALAVEGFEETVAGLASDFSLHICFSDYRQLLPALLEARSCREWALEFANREQDGHDPYLLLKELRDYGDTRRIGLGVLDVHRDEVEAPELVASRIRRAAEYLGDPERIRVNPDCGLRTRSWDVIWAKLRAMVEGTERARRSWGS
jgi:5-methyltetrahydropteroyltriglutamate--homocysteine methyltransferase